MDLVITPDAGVTVGALLSGAPLAVVVATLPPWGIELLVMTLPLVALVALWLVWILALRFDLVPRGVREVSSPDLLPLDRRWLQTGWAAIALALVSWMSEAVLRWDVVGMGGRIAVLLAPLIPLAWFIVAWRRERVRGDELDHRIQLDALSFAFPIFVLFMIGSELSTSLGWPTASPSRRWQMMPFLYGLGIWLFKFWYTGEGALRSARGAGDRGAADEPERSPTERRSRT